MARYNSEFGTRYETLADIRQHNADINHHWFEPETMRFFSSRVEPDVIGGYLFVSSEQDTLGHAWDGRRMFTVRGCYDGAIRTVSEFGQYSTKAEAVRAARFIAGNGSARTAV